MNLSAKRGDKISYHLKSENHKIIFYYSTKSFKFDR